MNDTQHRPLQQNWGNLKGRRVWVVGYSKQVIAGSGAVRTILVMDGHHILEVCEHEVGSWVEPLPMPEPKKTSSDHLNDIFNIANEALLNNNYHHPKTVQYDLRKILTAASRGLGLTEDEAKRTAAESVGRGNNG